MPLSKSKSIYFITDHVSKAYKIGIAQNPLARLKDLQVGNPYPLVLTEIIENATHEMESALHKQFAKDRLHGEWFRCYSPGDKLLVLCSDGVEREWPIPELDADGQAIYGG